MNIVNVTSIVDFNAIRYKKQYNDSPQVLLNRAEVSDEYSDEKFFFSLSTYYV